MKGSGGGATEGAAEAERGPDDVEASWGGGGTEATSGRRASGSTSMPPALSPATPRLVPSTSIWSTKLTPSLMALRSTAFLLA